MRMAVIVPFLNEEEHLGLVLRSIAEQNRPPDALLLVDDGSTDRSVDIASAFAHEHGYAQVLRRPPRPQGGDRLRGGSAVKAFLWGAARLEAEWDLLGKLDADVSLTPAALATLEATFESDPSVGIAGVLLSEISVDGRITEPRWPLDHVPGATKFYRRACLEEISPIPASLGWDTIDVARARMRQWKTASVEVPDGRAIHLRQMGAQNGLTRGYRRWGECAYAYGEHPLYAGLMGLQRIADHPVVLGAVNYWLGFALAAVRGIPRAEPELRRFVRRTQSRRLRQKLAGACVRRRRTPSIR